MCYAIGMMRLLPAVAFLALLILPQAVWGQHYDRAQLAKVKEISVSVLNDLKDGCVPSPDVLKIEAEQILKHSGINVTERTKIEDTPHVLFILLYEPNPYTTPNSKYFCFGSIVITLVLADKGPNRTGEFVEIAQDDRRLAVLQIDSQDQALVSVNVMVTKIANLILKAREQ